MSHTNGHGPQAPPVPARLEQFERDMVRQGQQLAGLGSSGYDDQVMRRLAYVQARHGDNWLSLPLDEFVRELHRESWDVAGWAVLLAQHPALMAIDDEQRLKVRMHLIEVIKAGALVEHEIRQLEHVLGE